MLKACDIEGSLWFSALLIFYLASRSFLTWKDILNITLLCSHPKYIQKDQYIIYTKYFYNLKTLNKNRKVKRKKFFHRDFSQADSTKSHIKTTKRNFQVTYGYFSMELLRFSRSTTTLYESTSIYDYYGTIARGLAPFASMMNGHKTFVFICDFAETP